MPTAANGDGCRRLPLDCAWIAICISSCTRTRADECSRLTFVKTFVANAAASSAGSSARATCAGASVVVPRTSCASHQSGHMQTQAERSVTLTLAPFCELQFPMHISPFAKASARRSAYASIASEDAFSPCARADSQCRRHARTQQRTTAPRMCLLPHAPRHHRPSGPLRPTWTVQSDSTLDSTTKREDPW